MSSPRDPDHPQSRWKRAITLAGAVSALNQGVADRRNGEAQLKHTAVRSRWASKTEYLLAMVTEVSPSPSPCFPYHENRVSFCLSFNAPFYLND